MKEDREQAPMLPGGIPRAATGSGPYGRWAWMVAASLLLLLYASWVRGGTAERYQGPFVWIGIAILALTFLRRGNAAVFSGGGSLFKDPVLYAGGLFLLYLGIQWCNAGRYPFFNPVDKCWEYTHPQVAWLPSAFSRREAGEMLTWFFPALALVLGIRNGMPSVRHVRMLLTVMAANGAIQAVRLKPRFGGEASTCSP